VKKRENRNSQENCRKDDETSENSHTRSRLSQSVTHKKVEDDVLLDNKKEGFNKILHSYNYLPIRRGKVGS